jgi:hypothetical protein
MAQIHCQHFLCYDKLQFFLVRLNVRAVNTLRYCQTNTSFLANVSVRLRDTVRSKERSKVLKTLPNYPCPFFICTGLCYFALIEYLFPIEGVLRDPAIHNPKLLAKTRDQKAISLKARKETAWSVVTAPVMQHDGRHGKLRQNVTAGLPGVTQGHHLLTPYFSRL